MQRQCHTATAAHGDIDMMLVKRPDKFVQFVFCGFMEGQTLHRVVFNDVDTDREVPGQCRQLNSILCVIVEILKGQIFVGDAVPGFR